MKYGNAMGSKPTKAKLPKGKMGEYRTTRVSSEGGNGLGIRALIRGGKRKKGM